MWNKPVVEIRVEEHDRGALPRLLDIYKRLALPVLVRHVGPPLAFYVPSVGRINCLTQLWAYDSLAEYELAQAAVQADPSWQDYLQAAQGLIRHRESRLTRRIAFGIVDEKAHDSHKKPFVDFRTYLIHFNQMQTFLDTTRKHAMQVMLRHVGPPVGYYLTTVGNLQQITLIWGYDSMADMEARRAARNADPEWKIYLDASQGIYERQETQVLHRVTLLDDR